MKRTYTKLTDYSGLRGTWTDSCLDFSRTISHQKCFCRTTIQRSTFGQWEWSYTSCCLVRCPSRVIRNLKSLATWSKVIFTSTMSLSKSIQQKQKISCSVLLWRTSTSALLQSKHLHTHGSRITSSITVKPWMMQPLQTWKTPWIEQGCRKSSYCIWARILSHTTWRSSRMASTVQTPTRQVNCHMISSSSVWIWQIWAALNENSMS